MVNPRAVKTRRHAELRTLSLWYFQACCANFLPVYTQVVLFLHFAVKNDIPDTLIPTYKRFVQALGAGRLWFYEKFWGVF